jgi:phage FluMu protein Com
MKHQTDDFIEIRCKVCNTMLLRVSPVTTGPIEPFCRQCKKTRLINLPIARKGQNKYDDRDNVDNNVS